MLFVGIISSWECNQKARGAQKRAQKRLNYGYKSVWKINRNAQWIDFYLDAIFDPQPNGSARWIKKNPTRLFAGIGHFVLCSFFISTFRTTKNIDRPFHGAFFRVGRFMCWIFRCAQDTNKKSSEKKVRTMAAIRFNKMGGHFFCVCRRYMDGISFCQWIASIQAYFPISLSSQAHLSPGLPSNAYMYRHSHLSFHVVGISNAIISVFMFLSSKMIEILVGGISFVGFSHFHFVPFHLLCF